MEDELLPPLNADANADAAAAPRPALLLNLPHLRAELWLHPVPNGVLAISFTGRGHHTLEGPGFAARALERAGFDVLALQTDQDDWYDSLGAPEVADLDLALARAYANTGRRPSARVGTGSDMGAHALLRHAALLRLDRVLAFSPVFDIRLPGETRWQADVPLLRRPPLDASAIRPGCQYHLVFDPQEAADARQVAALQSLLAPGQTHLAEVPYAGHPADRFFEQTGLLDKLVFHTLLSPTPRPAVWRPAHGVAQRQLSHTRLFLQAQACLARGRPRMALGLNSRALQLRPGEPDYQRQQCRILVQLGRLHEAIDLVRDVLRADPEHAALQQFLAHLEQRAGPMQPEHQAIRQLAEKLATPGTKLTPEQLPPVVEEAGRKHRPVLLKALEHAVAHYPAERLRQVFARIPLGLGEQIQLAKELGQALQAQGKLDSQQQVFELIRQHAPRNFWPYYEFARMATERKAHAQALDILGQGLAQAGPHLVATERHNLTQMVLKSLCLTRRDDRRYAAALAKGPRYSGRPVPNALFVAMVKNEADIIQECLASAYQVGLRYFVLADNGSTDGTGALVRAFAADHPDCVLLLLDDPIKGYWQATKTNLLWRFGQQYLAMTGVTIDWVLPIDADELLVQLDPAHDLAELLEQAQAAGKTVGVNMWCTATPTEILERLPEGVPMQQACPVVSGYDQNPSTKVFVRAQAGVTLEMGNHLVSGCLNQVDDAFVPAAAGLFLLHHPYRSRSQWRSKIVNGHQALAAANLPASAGSHWRSAYQRYQQEGEAYVDEVLRQYFSRNAASAARLQAESHQAAPAASAAPGTAAAISAPNSAPMSSATTPTPAATASSPPLNPAS